MNERREPGRCCQGAHSQGLPEAIGRCRAVESEASRVLVIARNITSASLTVTVCLLSWPPDDSYTLVLPANKEYMA